MGVTPWDSMGEPESKDPEPYWTDKELHELALQAYREEEARIKEKEIDEAYKEAL